MTVRFHPHAVERLAERGATEQEVIDTVQAGESFPAKFGRTGFRRNSTSTQFGGIGATRSNRSRPSRCVKGKIGL